MHSLLNKSQKKFKAQACGNILLVTDNVCAIEHLSQMTCWQFMPPLSSDAANHITITATQSLGVHGYYHKPLKTTLTLNAC